MTEKLCDEEADLVGDLSELDGHGDRDCVDQDEGGLLFDQPDYPGYGRDLLGRVAATEGFYVVEVFHLLCSFAERCEGVRSD